MPTVKDGQGMLGIQWSIEKVAHENGSVTLEPAVHIVSGLQTLVSIKVSSVAMLSQELLNGANAASTRMDELADRPGGESNSIGVRVQVPHERPGKRIPKPEK